MNYHTMLNGPMKYLLPVIHKATVAIREDCCPPAVIPMQRTWITKDCKVSLQGGKVKL